MEDYNRDFQEFSQAAGPNSDESPRAIELCELAGSADECTFHVGALINIYQNISTTRDRIAVKPLITMEINYYVRKMDRSVKRVNQILSFTHRVAIAETGERFKGDLRELIATMERIDLR